ncbi:hypothetical protein A1O1_00919 [Capronia coronata CBS 617.96]|uniref:SUR7 protein n=1 Tax=Capronia coronata CBS 617.96 TaxID=1182541 RepID=W9Z1F4_9EURO|nr:uncharacterized protein A1O1_00919 [Capronia coronata CBS 617.96]EXJ95795.1 hypothetical protein A1O1_00919 [Capronia coronata CBS 617.96]
MVNAGRICCIAAPFLLSVGVLVCMVLLFVAGTSSGDKGTNDLYFLKINLTDLTLSTSANLPSEIDGANTTILGGALQAAKQALGMKDYYTIYLRSYCSWNGNDVYANCTDSKTYFWFNPIEVWGLNDTGISVDDYLPRSFRDGLDSYHAASKAMFVLYAAALAASCLTILVGFSAIFSRWGSFFTTFFAAAMAVATIGATGTATAIFLILRTALNHTLKDDYGIHSSVGTKALAVTWIGTVFAVAAAFFWLLSVCCCSSRSPYNPGSREARRTRAEKTPYTYERVGSPYLGPSDQQAVPLSNLGPGNHGGGYVPPYQHPRGAAYEPFRAQQGV